MEKFMKEEIKHVQSLLRIPLTEVIDEFTESAIKNYQLRNNLKPTGNLDDPNTRTSFGLVNEDYTTDEQEKIGLKLNGKPPLFLNYFLPPEQYVITPTEKHYIFLHHTAGAYNPYNVVDGWKSDTRGKIGTEYIIGGTSIKNESYDGLCLRTFKTNGWASHLGGKPIDQYMHSHSVGIELCNYGWLTRVQSQGYYNYLGKIIPDSEVITLKEEFRGFIHWHKYTDLQIEKLKVLLLDLSDLHNIDITKGLKEMIIKWGPTKAFGKWDDIVAGKKQGLLTHANVRSDKFDCSPQPNLVDMILSL